MFDFNDAKMVKEKLKELVDKNIPKMSLDKLLEIDRFSYLKSYMDKATESEITEANEHFNKYCVYGYNDGKDIFSNENCSFYWGLKHGEMITDDNGLARTYYHYISLGGTRHKIELLLQYHPDCYEVEE